MTSLVRFGRGALALALASALASGCAKDDPRGAMAYADSVGSAAPRPAPPSSDLTDAQIAGVVTAIGEAAAETAALARARARDPRVRAFAERVAADHAAMEEARALLRARGEVAQPHALAQQAAQEGETNRALLSGLYDRAFDRAYVEREADSHETLLLVVDRSLLPTAETPEMRAVLERLRPVLAAHAAEAGQLREALGQE